MVEGSRGTIRRRTCLFDIVVCRRTSRLQQDTQSFHMKAEWVHSTFDSSKGQIHDCVTEDMNT